MLEIHQKTILKPISFSGIGLHNGLELIEEHSLWIQSDHLVGVETLQFYHWVSKLCRSARSILRLAAARFPLPLQVLDLFTC